MDRKHYVGLAALMVAASFVGGAVSSRFFTHTVVQTRYMPDQGKVIQAEEFCLVDNSGNTRAALTMHENRPVFYLVDNSGTERLSIGLYDNNNPGFLLWDSKGLARASLTLEKEISNPVFRLNDSSQNSRIGLIVTKEDIPSLVMNDNKGNTRFCLVSQADGGAALLITDENNKPVWSAP